MLPPAGGLPQSGCSDRNWLRRVRTRSLAFSGSRLNDPSLLGTVVRNHDARAARAIAAPSPTPRTALRFTLLSRSTDQACDSSSHSLPIYRPRAKDANANLNIHLPLARTCPCVH